MDAQEVGNQFEVVFFPLMAHSHIIPLVDTARLFASRGVKATFVVTAANAPIISETDNVELEIIRFPSEEVGLPAGIENVGQLTEPDHRRKFTAALKLMTEGPLAELVQKRQPSCLVSDMFLPWAADVATTAGVPWMPFNVVGHFAHSVTEVVRRDRPQWAVESDEEEFVVPGLPGVEVRLTRRRLPAAWTTKEAMEDEELRAYKEMVEAALDAAAKRSFGVIFNSFYELESDYADYYRKLSGRRCWNLGPVSMSYRNKEDKATRGKQASVDVHECLCWLDSKPPNSVIYVGFGSMTHVSSAQLREIAMALEASGLHFVWVIREPNIDGDEEEWMPSGFEARNEGRGLVIRGWAPQLVILDHVATGGFLTHCGWNAALEGVSAGLPMVTWPIFAEQFMTEKLITEVLRVGVSVGADHNHDWMVPEARVRRKEIEAAVRRVMVGEEGEEMRRRAAKLKDLAWKAVQPGGSSYNDLSELLKEL